jgi:hypothetical protein
MLEWKKKQLSKFFFLLIHDILRFIISGEVNQRTSSEVLVKSSKNGKIEGEKEEQEFSLRDENKSQ